MNHPRKKSRFETKMDTAEPASLLLANSGTALTIAVDSEHLGAPECYNLKESNKTNHALKEINLKNNGIEDEGGKQVARMINNAPNLEVVRIKVNKIKNESIKEIAESLARKPRIKKIDLSANEFTDLAPLLQPFTRTTELALTVLNLSRLRITSVQEVQNMFQPVFDKCVHLKSLNMSHSNLGDAGALAILRAIKKSKTLESINLSGNLMTNNICFVISDVIGVNTQIRHLYIAENYMGENAFAIENRLKELETQAMLANEGRSIDLSDERSKQQRSLHHRTVWTDFATGIGANRGLETLDLEDNGISAMDIQVLFTQMRKHGHRTLKTLLIGDNFEYSQEPAGIDVINALETTLSPGELNLTTLNLSGTKRLQSSREIEVKSHETETETETSQDDMDTSGTDHDPPGKVHAAISSDGIKELFQLQTRYPTLTELVLDNNLITQDCAVTIGECLARGTTALQHISFNFCEIVRDKDGKSGMEVVIKEILKGTKNKVKSASFWGCDIRFQDVKEAFSSTSRVAERLEKLDLSYNRLIGFESNGNISDDGSGNGNKDGKDERKQLNDMIVDIRKRFPAFKLTTKACDLKFTKKVEVHCYDEINELSIHLEGAAKRRLLKQCRAILRQSKMAFHKNDLEAMLFFVSESAELDVHMRFKRTVSRCLSGSATEDPENTCQITLIQKLSESDHLMNLFETGFSGGNTDSDKRRNYERNMFGRVYDAQPSDDSRPKYGTVNMLTYVHGDQAAKAYGKSYISLRHNVKMRATISSADSVFPMIEIGTLEHPSVVLLDCFNRLKRVVIVDKDTNAPITVTATTDGNTYETYKFRDEVPYEQAERTRLLLEHLMYVGVHRDAVALGRKKHLGLMPGYIEAQIHGNVLLDEDIEKVCIHPSDGIPEVQHYASVMTKKFKGIRSAVMYTGDVSCIRYHEHVFGRPVT
eukprot:m.326261 g.326261  ORF g.326261 m.326261 type:complete len:936 (+) comp16557_c1_seq2:97-2904(+)